MEILETIKQYIYIGIKKEKKNLNFSFHFSFPPLFQMLQSQIINVLPRRILAGLWATQETRISLNHLMPHKSANEKR